MMVNGEEERVSAAGKEDFVPETRQAWYDWLSIEEARTFRVYKEDPNRFLADFRSELQTVRDYEGREILELLQNANDAAAEKGSSSRVIIELTPEGLVVGNTGLPFSTGGIRSLRLAHLSPKASQRKQFVGNKGLGFRSVLNWTRTPIILSGNLQLAYSQMHLRQKQQEVVQLIPDLKELIDKEPVGSSRLVIPLLTFPCVPAAGDLADFLAEDKQKVILSRCMRLREENLDTVIGMPFDQPSFYAHAREQIEELGHETLLFAPHLGELEIRIEGEDESHELWVKETRGETVQIISENSDDFWEYRIFREADEIPAEFHSEETGNTLSYEIVLALPTENGIKSGYLYSYFRTEVRFPFPLLAHATLELQANRQQPQDVKPNRFVLSRLASLMTETAEQIASGANKWAGCHLLAQDSSELNPALVKLGFQETILRESKNKKIVPTLGGALKSAEECNWLGIQDTSWLPPKLFSCLVEASSDENISNFLKKLRIEKLDDEDWRNALLNVEFGNLEDRVTFLAGLIKNELLDEETPVGLLLDESGKAITNGSRIFLPPREGIKHPLPEWIKVRFLNSELSELLQKKMNIGNIRALVAKLSPWDVKEYSLDNVISVLVAETNRRIKEEDSLKDHYTQELLQILLKLFPKDRDSRPLFPKEAGIRLKSQSGDYVEARKLYLSNGYGRYGNLMQSLYGLFDLGKLIAPTPDLGLDNEDSQQNLLDFFYWLGVEKLPREIREDRFSDKEYRAYLLSEISYPVLLKYGGVADVRRNVPSDWNYPCLNEVRTIDALDRILEHAETEAILAWLAIDPRVREWEEWTRNHVELLDSDGYQRYYRKYDETLPCYITWKIRNMEWVATTEGKRKPGDCFFGEKRFGKLLTEPVLRPDHPHFAQFDVWPNIIEAFNRAGGLTRISHLDREQVYRLLLSLPEKDPDGKSARNLYTLLLQHEDSFFGNAGKAFNQFKSAGKMWGRYGEEYGYYLVSNLHYIDSEDVPEALAEKIKLIELPKRQGSAKVERFFGVTPVNKNKIEYHLDHFVPLDSAEWLNNEFKAIKPILYALRQAKTSQSQYLAAFKRLEIKVCSDIQGHLLYESERFPLSLEGWEWILDGDVAYILQDSERKTSLLQLSNAFLADAIGSVIAAIFRLETGSDFARLIQCPRHDRIRLLEKMLGGEPLPDLNQLAEDFEVAAQGNNFNFDLPNAEKEAKADSFEKGQENKAQTNQTEQEDDKKVEDEDNKEEQGPLGIDEKEHTPSEGKRVRLRVQKRTSQANRVRSSHLVTDGEFCEKKAMEFELMGDPPRYPLHVANVTGYNGPRCDILSFATLEVREAFKISKNPELIARFIEVKGRSSGGASILLKGNELEAAKNYGERYFLYRLYVERNGNYELSVLQDPLQDPEAIENMLEINFESALTTHRFGLHGGIRQGDHNDWDGSELPEYEVEETYCTGVNP